MAQEHPPAPTRCLRCGAEIPPGGRFCPNCGWAVPDAAAPPPAPEAPELETIYTPPPLTPAPPQYAPGSVFPGVSPVEYMGFWVRVLAWLIDLILIGVAEGALARLRLGPAIALLGPTYLVLMTGLRGQTLGKMALGLRVVDSQGNIPGLGRALLREVVGRFVSGIALGLGYFWIGWDQRKRGWHDYIGGTYVIRQQRRPSRLP